VEPAEMNQLGIDFIKTDLDVAATFVRTARESTNQEKTRRNTLNARKAYDAVSYYLKRITLTQVEQENIKTKLEWIKAALADLGEAV
jgi:hypothetical protein